MAAFTDIIESVSILLQKMTAQTPTSSTRVPALNAFETLVSVAKETSPDAEGSRWRILVNHTDQLILFYLLDTTPSTVPRILRSIRVQPAPADTVYPGARLIAHVFIGSDDVRSEVLQSIPFENSIRQMGDLMKILDLMGVFSNRENLGIVQACGAEFVRGFEGQGGMEKEASPEITPAAECQPAPTRIDTVVAADRPPCRKSPSLDKDSGICSGPVSPNESSPPAEKSDTGSFSLDGLYMFCQGPLRRIVDDLVSAIRIRDRTASSIKRKRFYSNPELDKVLCELEYELLKRGRKARKEKKDLMRRLASFAGCTVGVLHNHMKNACDRVAKGLIATGKQ